MTNNARKIVFFCAFLIFLALLPLKKMFSIYFFLGFVFFEINLLFWEKIISKMMFRDEIGSQSDRKIVFFSILKLFSWLLLIVALFVWNKDFSWMIYFVSGCVFSLVAYTFRQMFHVKHS